MEVSIIIVNYNTKQLTLNCLRSIISQTKDIDFEIIVVDNASNDNSCAAIKEACPSVKIIESKENLGFGKANNVGMEIAKGKYCFLLNSDTILENNAIKYFLDYCENTEKKIGVLGCILKGQDGQNVHSYGEFLTTKRMLRHYFNRLILHKTNPLLAPSSVDNPIDVEYITGADMFLPKSVFIDTGGFSPDFFMYYEESDWQKRMERLGYRRLIINGPKIIHLEGGSDPSKSRQWAFRRIREFERSSIIYMKRNVPRLQYIIYRLVNISIKLPLIMFYREDSLKNKFALIKVALYSD